MRSYDPVPQWWFCIILVSTILSIFSCSYFKKQLQLPPWGVLLACTMGIFLAIPGSVISATTGMEYWGFSGSHIYNQGATWVGLNLFSGQEVDRYDDLLSGMRNKGYIGSIKRRTREAMDGCAIFWKENLFCLLEGESIEFKGFGLRDNVAQLFVFEILDVHLD
ncbi:carbon catabolite repressor protein 4 homolog 6-like isoform X1 [Tasmannia lanceolata]|uniref:carbon catabolite repressor protein 4 homolog 6-like isoform X1 n=1 Tax=Tasmannia lanceolata TaxID=3420 RepID=UPI0040631822